MLKPVRGRQSSIALVLAAAALVGGIALAANTVLRAENSRAEISETVKKMVAIDFKSDTLDLIYRVIAPLAG